MHQIEWRAAMLGADRCDRAYTRPAVADVVDAWRRQVPIDPRRSPVASAKTCTSCTAPAARSAPATPGSRGTRRYDPPHREPARASPYPPCMVFDDLRICASPASDPRLERQRAVEVRAHLFRVGGFFAVVTSARPVDLRHREATALPMPSPVSARNDGISVTTGATPQASASSNA
jgi:hypothetical protein